MPRDLRDLYEEAEVRARLGPQTKECAHPGCMTRIDVTALRDKCYFHGGQPAGETGTPPVVHRKR